MSFWSHWKIGKLYSNLLINENVFPDKQTNRDLKKREDKLLYFKKNGIYTFFFSYKTEETDNIIPALRKMRLSYDPNESHLFTVLAESRSIIRCKDYELLNGDARKAFEISFPNAFLMPAATKVSYSGKMRGKNIDSGFILGQGTEDGKIVGYMVQRKEPFYDDNSRLRTELYDDLEGLARLCDNIDSFLNDVKIEKKEQSSPGNMFS